MVAIRFGGSARARRFALFVEVLFLEVVVLLVDELVLGLLLVLELVLRLLVVLELVLGAILELVLGLFLEVLLVLRLLIELRLVLRLRLELVLGLLRRLDVLHLMPELRPRLEAVQLGADDPVREMNRPGQTLDGTFGLDVQGELQAGETRRQLVEREYAAGVHSFCRFPLDSERRVQVGDLEFDRSRHSADLQIEGDVIVVALLGSAGLMAPSREILESSGKREGAAYRQGEVDRLLDRNRRVLAGS